MTDENDRHAVYVGALRVLLFEEDGGWSAQGVEIDYAACGDSMEDAKRRFEQGQVDTLKANIDASDPTIARGIERDFRGGG